MKKTLFEGKIASWNNVEQLAKDILQLVPLYYDKSKIWYKYNQNKYYWEKVDEIDILNSIQTELKIANISQSHIKNQILTALQMESRKNSPQELKRHEIQFVDKIIDITTGETKPANSKYFTFNSIPWRLGEIEDTPNMDEFIKSWVGTEYLKTVQEWMAYNMLCDYPIHRVACFTGSGSNGKSTLIKLMRKITGKHNIIGGELDTVFLERFGLSNLHRKTGIVMGETNFQRLTRTGKFKAATGEDPLLIEYKGKDGFDYINYAKVTICTNSLPITEDKTDGFYRRWLIIQFPNQFTERINVLKQIPEIEYENFCRKSIRILKELLNKGTFDNEGNIEQRRDQYEKISNPLTEFLKEQTINHSMGSVTRKEFNKRLRVWLRNKGQRIPSDMEVSKVMKQYYETRWENRERVWLGISFKDEIKIERVI